MTKSGGGGQETLKITGLFTPETQWLLVTCLGNGVQPWNQTDLSWKELALMMSMAWVVGLTSVGLGLKCGTVIIVPSSQGYSKEWMSEWRNAFIMPHKEYSVVVVTQLLFSPFKVFPLSKSLIHSINIYWLLTQCCVPEQAQEIAGNKTSI